MRILRRPQTPISTHQLLLLLVTTWQLVSCGYRPAVRNRLPLGVRTLSIEPLKNETTTFEVEQILTRSLVHAFVEGSGLKIVNDPKKADAVLKGVVSGVSATPVIFGQETFGTAFLVTLSARVQVLDQRSGRVIFENNGYIFREQYVINVDLKNFFSELNPALERIARDFSTSVVASVIESF
ncbi:MAG: hypothetical protein HY645_08520 [Acidobacteria bacterium]|nr:hypothetical protein [Acidobacteriota bacterium]